MCCCKLFFTQKIVIELLVPGTNSTAQCEGVSQREEVPRAVDKCGSLWVECKGSGGIMLSRQSGKSWLEDEDARRG